MNYAEYQRQYYKQRKRLGCVGCGQRKERNKSRCPRCAAIHARKARKLYNAKRPRTKPKQQQFMIHRLIDKLRETLPGHEAILLMATYEKSGLEWARRSDLIKDIICFAAADTKRTKLATDKLEKMGYFECENRTDAVYARHKWVRVTDAGKRFLNQCYRHAQGKVAV